MGRGSACFWAWLPVVARDPLCVPRAVGVGFHTNCAQTTVMPPKNQIIRNRIHASRPACAPEVVVALCLLLVRVPFPLRRGQRGVGLNQALREGWALHAQCAAAAYAMCWITSIAVSVELASIRHCVRAGPGGEGEVWCCVCPPVLPPVLLVSKLHGEPPVLRAACGERGVAAAACAYQWSTGIRLPPSTS